jgi:uncharacterized protein (TIGR00369 family)
MQINSNLQSMLQQLSVAFTTIPFNRMLGLQLDALEENHVIMSFPMKNDLIGNFLQGILHGGVISSVLDMAGGMLVMASAIRKHPDGDMEEITNILGRCSTIDLQVSYMRPGKGDRFIAKASLLKSGNKIAFTRMELQNQNEVVIATGSGTYHMG